MKQVFTNWWIMILAIATTVFWLGYYGIISNILHVDITHLTALTSMFCLIITGIIGSASYRVNLNNLAKSERILELGYFSADICMSLGLLGTVIGCIVLFSTSVTSVDMKNQAQVLSMLGQVSTSLGTALCTTAVGVATSIILKLQSFNLQYAIDKLKGNE